MRDYCYEYWLSRPNSRELLQNSRYEQPDVSPCVKPEHNFPSVLLLPFCFPFLSYKISLPPILLFCLPGTEDMGKGDSLVKVKKPALCQQPQAVCTLGERFCKLMCWGIFSAKLQRVSKASSVAKKYFPEGTNLSLSWELSTVHNIAPHSPQTANSRCDSCM